MRRGGGGEGGGGGDVSANADQLMRLQRKPPGRMARQYRAAASRFSRWFGPSMGWRKKCWNFNRSKWPAARRSAGRRASTRCLRAAREERRPSGSRKSSRCPRSRARSIGLQRHREAASVKRIDQGRVELQRRLAAGANHIGLAGRASTVSCQIRSTASASISALSNLPPPGRHTPRNRYRKTGRTPCSCRAASRSRDCSPRSEGRRPPARLARPHPAVSGRFL